jgi:deoxycytidine triphosphate deaminase
MIEPFAPEPGATANGSKIVSYGTSSYGYDVRCSREFKIFTNINSTIVDPKGFDEKSFVDVTADVCIIPAELLRAGAHLSNISGSALDAGGLPGKVDLRALRHHRAT